MARKKSTKISKPRVKKTSKTSKVRESNNPATKTTNPLKLSESYVSLALGALVVVLLAVAFLALMKGGNAFKKMEDKTLKSATPSSSFTLEPGNKNMQTYILKEGESVWDVAVKFYGDGYKWTVISEANGFGESADYIEPGTKLKIPQIK